MNNNLLDKVITAIMFIIAVVLLCLAPAFL